MRPTDIRVPDYFHKVVDCQWACPAHTPVPEYIRMIAAGRYADAYMVNWKSNVFPGILGRTCDRPCEPACRRGRVEENNGEAPEPVAICRLKRVAADNKGDVTARMPKAAAAKNGRRIACVGAGPASLTLARDLSPLGYSVTVFEADGTQHGAVGCTLQASGDGVAAGSPTLFEFVGHRLNCWLCRPVYPDSARASYLASARRHVRSDALAPVGRVAESAGGHPSPLSSSRARMRLIVSPPAILAYGVLFRR